MKTNPIDIFKEYQAAVVYHYFAKIKVNGIDAATSRVATLTVA